MPPAAASQAEATPAAVAYSARPPAVQPSPSSLDFRKDFFFRRRHGALDWNRLRAVDLERVVRTVDVDALQENVEHVTFADISEADLAQLTDANFLQLFRLTQLIIEYLLNVQNFLLASAKKKEVTYESVLAELEATRQALQARTESERATKKELKYCRRVIKAYERNLGSKWNDLNAHAVGPTGAPPSRCGVCASVFVSHEFLVGHYKRRHPDETLPLAPMSTGGPSAGASPPGTLQAQDLAAWKKEMESALRAQLAESQRTTTRTSSVKPLSKVTDAESAMSRRLAKLESTLSAVLNNNTVPIKADSGEKATAAKESRATALRDDNGGARLTEDTDSLKEYLRRQLFDLHEEVRQLKDQRADQVRQGQYEAPYHARHEPMHDTAAAGAGAPLSFTESSLSPRSEDHAQALMRRFQSKSTLSHAVPHAPTYPHVQAVATPHGVGTVPRHVPTAVSSLHPTPPTDERKKEAAPPEMSALRATLLQHLDKQYELFPDLPGLKSRFLQQEGELLSHLNSFAVLSATIVEHGRVDEVLEEVRLTGCEDMLPETEREVEEYVKKYYRRDGALIEAFRLLAERQQRNEALAQEHAAREQEEQRQLDYIRQQREALESERLRQEAQRKREAEVAEWQRRDGLRKAQEEDAAAAAEANRRYQEHVDALASPNFTTQSAVAHRPPPLTAFSPSPSPMPVSSPFGQANTNPNPTPSPSSSATPYPAATPLASQLAANPLASPTPFTQASRSNASGTTVSLAPISSTSALHHAMAPAASPFSNNPNILNPSLALAGSGAPPSVGAQNSNLPPPIDRQASAAMPKGILKRPAALRGMDDDDEDDEDEFEQKQPSGGPTVAAAAIASSGGVGAPSTISPSGVIPPRPNKQAIAAMSARGGQLGQTPQSSVSTNPPAIGARPTSLAASSVSSVMSGDPNAIQPFTSSPGGSSTGESPAFAPRAAPGHVRSGSRRLGAARGDDSPVEPTEEAKQQQSADDVLEKRNSTKAPLTRGGSLAGGLLEADTQYEHSEARQDVDGADEDGGGLAHEYEPPTGADEVDDVHHFSPPARHSPSRRITHLTGRDGGPGRLHSDEEEADAPTMLRTAQAPPNRHRNLADSAAQAAAVGLASPPIGLQSRFAHPTTATHQSANFSVADSRDWKSDADDLLDDDIEELVA